MLVVLARRCTLRGYTNVHVPDSQETTRRNITRNALTKVRPVHTFPRHARKYGSSRKPPPTLLLIRQPHIQSGLGSETQTAGEGVLAPPPDVGSGFSVDGGRDRNSEDG